MTLRTFLLISAGAVLGANARYLIAGWAASRWGASFPWGTVLINISGSFLLGLLIAIVGARYDNSPAARALLATGFLGSYTTFSTFAFESVLLGQRGAYLAALGNALGSVACGVVAAAAGFWLGRLIV